jgi:hypothetical protein
MSPIARERVIIAVQVDQDWPSLVAGNKLKLDSQTLS